jgi:FeoB-associated Cys-rich membrane protein
VEILITLIIVAFAGFTIYKTVRKSSKGGCNCGSCSNHCPMYEDKENGIKLEKKK